MGKSTVSLILGHPTPGSFNHGIAQTAQAALAGAGHAVCYHDLYQEKFDPVMVTEEIPRGAAMPPEVERHAAELERADGLVIVHPNWWSQPPAMLKGWVDRVLRPGRAYNFVADGKGGGKAVGLLKIRTVLVVTTANNPQENEVAVYGDPLEVFWRKVVFSNCGIPQVRRLIFSPVIGSLPAQRQQWLAEVCKTVGELFPRGD
jgi:putative NADPH-quinone reductase